MMPKRTCFALNITIFLLALLSDWAAGFSHDLPSLIFPTTRPLAHRSLARCAKRHSGCISLVASRLFPDISSPNSEEGKADASIQDRAVSHFSTPLESMPLEKSAKECLDVGRKGQTRPVYSSKTQPYISKGRDDKDLGSRRLLLKLGLAVGIRRILPSASHCPVSSTQCRVLSWLSPTHLADGVADRRILFPQVIFLPQLREQWS
jgi:hypothetical protein